MSYEPGDRVWLILPTAQRGRGGQRVKRPHVGTVTEVVNDGRSVRIDLDQPALTPDCLATIGEVHKIVPERPS